MNTVHDIWQGDLFGRAKEAELLIGYLESVSAQPSFREDAQGYTIAVDASYGEGKTFFLKRLAKHLALSHPVAFVDAWADDIADEPLTALAATLKKALDPLLSTSSEVRTKFETVLEKSGKIAKLVGVGLLKKGAGLVLTAAVADTLTDVMSGADKDVRESAKKSLEKSGDEAIKGGIEAIQSVAPGTLMEDRISAFEERQRALLELKESLAALVSALDHEALAKPIFIIIDELDRCRPTYAIKLLEEVKHLFDVPGLVFIMGLHGEQLAHSVGAAYGLNFASKKYLRRFFNRQYRLAEPDLLSLVLRLCQQAGLEKIPASSFPTVSDHAGVERKAVPQVVADYMAYYGVPPRGAFEVVDILQTCSALASGMELQLNYLMPLIIGHIEGQAPGRLPEGRGRAGLKLFLATGTSRRQAEGEEVDPHAIAEQFKVACELPYYELSSRLSSDGASYVERYVSQRVNWRSDQAPIYALSNYPKLLTTVSRFREVVQYR